MLTKKIAVYIPSKIGQELIPADKRNFWKEVTLKTLSELYGGATTIEGHGAWLSPIDGLVLEPVTIAYTYVEESTDITPVYSLARTLARELKQEAIAVEIGNGMDFVVASEEEVVA